MDRQCMCLICCLLFAFVLAPDLVEGQGSLESCKGDQTNNPTLPCGDVGAVQVTTAMLGYNDVCQTKTENNSYQKDVSSLFQTTCDGYYECEIPWSSIECLSDSSTANVLNSLLLVFNCSKTDQKTQDITINNCSAWVFPNTTQSPTTFPATLRTFTSSVVTLTDVDTSPVSIDSSLNQTSSNLSTAETSTFMHTPTGSPDQSTSHTISHLQTFISSVVTTIGVDTSPVSIDGILNQEPSNLSTAETSTNDEKDLIIYAAAGGGGGLILIVIIIITICCCMRRRKSKETTDSENDSVHLENGVQMNPVTNNGKFDTNSSREDNNTHTDVTHDMYAPVNKSISHKKPSLKIMQHEEDEANYVCSDKPAVPPKMPDLQCDTSCDSPSKENIDPKEKEQDNTYEDVVKNHDDTASMSSVSNTQNDAPMMPGVNDIEYNALLMPGMTNGTYDAPMNNQYDAPLVPGVNNNQYDAPLIPSGESTPVTSRDSDVLHIQASDYVESYAKTSGDDIISKPSVRSKQHVTSDVVPDDSFDYDYADMIGREGSIMDNNSVAKKDMSDEKDKSDGASNDYSDVEIQQETAKGDSAMEIRHVPALENHIYPDRDDNVVARSSAKDKQELEKKTNKNGEASLVGTIMVENEMYNN